MPDVRQTLREVAPPTTGTVDVDAIRARSRVLTRRRRAVRGAAGVVVAALALGLPLRALLDDGPDDSVRAVDGGTTTTTTTTAAPASPTTAATSATTTSNSTASAPVEAGATTTRILNDVRGDVEPGGFGGQTAPPDPSLDILALDVAYDGESMTFIHQLDGPPDRPPEGADGRIHTTNFQVPGHDRVQIFVQTLRRDLEINIGVVKADVYGGVSRRCLVCDVDFDGEGNRFVLRVPLSILNEVMRDGDAGQIAPGTELTNWHITSERNWTSRDYVDERESPHYYAGGQADDVFNADYVYRVP